MDFFVLLLVIFLVFLVAGWGWRSMRRSSDTQEPETTTNAVTQA